MPIQKRLVKRHLRARRRNVYSGVFKGRLGRYRRMRNIGTHYFTRNTRPIIYSLGNTLNWVPESLTFQLSDVINVSDFVNLFDQFKIHKVVLTLRWSPNQATYTSNNTQAGTGVYNPLLYYTRDYDDDNPIATQQDMLEIQKHNSRRLMPGRPVIISLRPAVQAQAYQTAISTAYGPKWNMKLNMDDNTTPHYGLKMGVTKLGQDMGAVSIDVKYHFSCYGVS